MTDWLTLTPTEAVDVTPDDKKPHAVIPAEPAQDRGVPLEVIGYTTTTDGSESW